MSYAALTAMACLKAELPTVSLKTTGYKAFCERDQNQIAALAWFVVQRPREFDAPTATKN